ncbi:MAG: glutamate racemase [Flavobacterium sp.]|nr:glutamate racemase [Pedobacter sp.]
MSSSLPIGIFDSGIGGLTVAAAISKILPNEQLIYFGDTAHLPYGDKSPEAIKDYSIKIARFLISQDCKMIVIACNTASSHAYFLLKEEIGNLLPVINVIDPVVASLVSKKKYRNVGVIGTRSTIQSDIYASKIALSDPSIEVRSLATPLLAPMIEEGFINSNISFTIINSYLSSPKLKNIDSLVLACTHYPLIKTEIEQYYQGNVDIINTAEIVADHVNDKLTALHLLNTSKTRQHRFYVSDYTKSFEESTRYFFGKEIHLKQQDV